MSIKEIKAKIKALHEQAMRLNIKSLQYAEVIDEIKYLKEQLLMITP